MRNDDHDGNKPLPNRPRQDRTAEDLPSGMAIIGLMLLTFKLYGVAQITIATARELSSSWKRWTGGSFRSSFQEEAWKRYNRRMREEYEEEMERVERIRRMQSVFNRERSKYKRSYENWRESGPGAYRQHFQREDWYWKTNTSNRDQWRNFQETPQCSASYALSHHYSVLGLNRLRTEPYTDDEIKTAFRAQAMQYHPDKNKDNKEVAEALFKEVLTSYEAIKTERKKQ